MIVASFWLSILLTFAPDRQPAASAAVVSPKALFDQYARGDYGAVETALKRLTDPRPFIKAFKHDSQTWTQVPDPDEAERRRLVVATVALEVVYLPHAPPTDTALANGQVWLSGRYAEVRGLTEWACALVRQSRLPTPAERLWHWLAIALMEGDAWHAPLEIHVRHALDRFPTEPRFILARAIAAELRTAPDERGRSPQDRDRSATETLVARLQAAEQIAAIRSEANVRHGYLLLRLGEPAAALTQIGDPATIADDPYLTHLAWLFRGRAFDALDRVDEATAAYREAVSIVPHAQTAEMALAAVLAKRGDRAEAESVARAAITTDQEAVDPWRMYGPADARVWPRIRDALRQELRK